MSPVLCFELQSRARKNQWSQKFAGPYYIIKRIPTLVLGALEPVQVDFLDQNTVKILH